MTSPHDPLVSLGVACCELYYMPFVVAYLYTHLTFTCSFVWFKHNVSDFDYTGQLDMELYLTLTVAITLR